MDSTTAWERELDHIEWYVDAVEDAVARGDLVSLAATTPWEPRPDLGALPAELEARTADILGRQRVALAALAQAGAQVRDELGLLTTISHGTGATPNASFVDQAM